MVMTVRHASTQVGPPACGAVVSVCVRALMKATCSKDSCGFFGSGGFIIFEVTEGQENFEVSEVSWLQHRSARRLLAVRDALAVWAAHPQLLPVLLLGVVGGLLGSLFIAVNGRLAGLRRMYLAPHGPKAGGLAPG